MPESRGLRKACPSSTSSGRRGSARCGCCARRGMRGPKTRTCWRPKCTPGGERPVGIHARGTGHEPRRACPRCGAHVARVISFFSISRHPRSNPCAATRPRSPRAAPRTSTKAGGIPRSLIRSQASAFRRSGRGIPLSCDAVYRSCSCTRAGHLSAPDVSLSISRRSSPAF